MLRARDIMDRDVIIVNEDTSVHEICAILTRNKLSGLPVVDKKGDLVGFISERDIIAAVNKKDFLSSKAKKLMTRKVFSVQEDAAAEELSRVFTENPYRYVPVVKNRKVVGIISRRDMISRLLGQYY